MVFDGLMVKVLKELIWVKVFESRKGIFTELQLNDAESKELIECFAQANGGWLAFECMD